MEREIFLEELQLMRASDDGMTDKRPEEGDQLGSSFALSLETTSGSEVSFGGCELQPQKEVKI